jgi:Spy/CpxP family protein refolding chaperone
MYRIRFLALGLLAGGLLAGSTPAAAQTSDAPHAAADSSHHARRDPITRLLEQRERLNLTAEQTRQLEAIRTKYQEKHKGQLEQVRRDREAYRALRASMDSARAEIAAVLTPEQEKQVEAMREEWKREWRQHRRQRHERRDG